MGRTVGIGKGSRGWEGQWEVEEGIGDGRGSRGWEGQLVMGGTMGMGGAVVSGRGSRRWEG